jgi:hypothetical protein
MKGHGPPKETDPTGGRGRGRGGRKIFIDKIISKSESVVPQQPRSRKPKPQPSFQKNFETETIEKPGDNIEDRASAVGEQTEETMDGYNEELHHEE